MATPRKPAKQKIPEGCSIIDGRVMTYEEATSFLDEKYPPVVDNVIPPKGWQPMTSAEAAKILAEEEPWPDDPDC